MKNGGCMNENRATTSDSQSAAEASVSSESDLRLILIDFTPSRIDADDIAVRSPYKYSNEVVTWLCII